MLTLEGLTALSSGCIVISGLSLLLGWYFIRVRSNRDWHRNAMLTATGFAALFLVFYVTRWASFGSKPFEGQGGWRVFYLSVLIPHVLLAMTVGPLAVFLIYLALLKQDFVRHRRWARVTLPVWLFVAGSGWLIYYLLYHMSF